MTKDKDIKTVVPALRFPEFRDAEGWEEKSLGNIAEIITGNTPSTTDYSNYGGDRMFVSPADISEYRYITKAKTLLSEKGFSQTRHIKANSVLFVCIGSTIGKVAQNKFECATNQQINSLVPYKGYISDFIYFILEYNASIIAEMAGKQAVPIINKSLFSSVLVYFPIQKEQQKIADCLGSLDDLISAVTDKIEALKEHKKGLMQHLFPADGKTTPTLRFPEFQNAGDWIETTLGEEVYYENGKAHENDIDEAGQYIVVNSKFISTDGEVIKYTDSPSCLADKGDILMVLSDVPNGRAIAKCFIVDSNKKYTVNQRICKLKPKKVIGLLLYYIINRNPFLLAFDDGIKQTNLKKDDVLNCPFRVPKDPKEQQRIADCLLAVDELTSAEADKLNQLKAHKKGLMQQLFPTINK